MTHELRCWKCGASLEEWSLPLSRRAECRACGAELHVCRMCAEYEPRAAGQCREDRAEGVTDKERANFCDWFQPSIEAWQPPDLSEAEAARAQLDALFGEGAAGKDSGPSETDAAREALERLFRGD